MPARAGRSALIRVQWEEGGTERARLERREAAQLVFCVVRTSPLHSAERERASSLFYGVCLAIPVLRARACSCLCCVLLPLLWEIVAPSVTKTCLSPLRCQRRKTPKDIATLKEFQTVWRLNDRHLTARKRHIRVLTEIFATVDGIGMWNTSLSQR